MKILKDLIDYDSMDKTERFYMIAFEENLKQSAIDDIKELKEKMEYYSGSDMETAEIEHTINYIKQKNNITEEDLE